MKLRQVIAAHCANTNAENIILSKIDSKEDENMKMFKSQQTAINNMKIEVGVKVFKL